MKYLFTFLCLITGLAQAQTVTIVEQNKPCSIRGLSVVDDKIAWISGSKGNIAISTTGGQNWVWQQIKGYEKSDFRDIEAFSDKEAIIMSSGTPAVILKTTDGGANWKEVYRKEDQAYFLDAMAFVDAKHGYCMGDPINGKFLLLETKDGGETWSNAPIQPDALPGEAAFAASGTCLTTPYGNDAVVMVTGGSKARKIVIADGKQQATPLPLTQGQASQGAFSYGWGAGKEIIIGGDYAKNTRTDSVAAHASFKKKQQNIQLSGGQLSGFQSCVTHLKGNIFIATGTPGSNITTDGGANWKPFDNNSFNVCQKAKRGNLVILAGDRGKIGVLKL